MGFSLAEAKINITDDLAVKAICGEAEGESFVGKVAIGESIRQRGHLNGVYGLKSPRLATISRKAWSACQKAWNESKKSKYTFGAEVWGTDSDILKFKKTKWFKSYRKTVKIGHHTFFKKIS